MIFSAILVSKMYFIFFFTALKIVQNFHVYNGERFGMFRNAFKT